MVYVVERYLPGLSRVDLLTGLSRLEPVIEELRGAGSVVRYLGSTIVLEDEACFCQFEAPSVAAVTDANRRADLHFDRIVPAVLVQPTHRSGDMSVSTSMPKAAVRRRSCALAAIAAVSAVVALATWAITARVVHSGGRSVRPAPQTQASVLRQLTPAERAYVLAVTSMTPVEMQAAFGTGLPSLTPREMRYVLGITALTPLQLSAAFGNSTVPPTARRATASSTPSSATTSPPVASPILPACAPGPCWHVSRSKASAR